MPVETMENPWSEASKNTTVVMRSIGSGPGKRSAFVNAARAGTSLQSHLGKHPSNRHEPYIPSKVVLKELDYSSSLHDDLYKFMQEQTKEHNELIKAFEGARVTIEKEHNLALAQVREEMGDGARAFSTYEKRVEQELHDCDATIANQRAMLEEFDTNLRTLRAALEGEFTRLDADGNAKFSRLSEEHGQLQQEVESRDRTVAQQRAALEHLQDEFRTLHAKLDCEIARVNTEKDSELAALTQNFSHLWAEKEAELVALAQKFEGALHQVEALKQSQ
ncbi:hypothetical protein PISMIDRAFT_14312 [Pisolithus microcarpus 441]|uniref:Uncharacterized protein n=1 Tax=Pisolithus microcarpus 441 TaxID=765257 RepID=A0A0C9YXE2_9AGAM|nr:hypothetical protein BKA83DRAFT_14312 [Pisolithus microcarpus]KIK18529.1 hypothetical protein PISMIDRAFT_14312 [Pisolithus microcarpus 441]